MKWLFRASLVLSLLLLWPRGTLADIIYAYESFDSIPHCDRIENLDDFQDYVFLYRVYSRTEGCMGRFGCSVYADPIYKTQDMSGCQGIHRPLVAVPKADYESVVGPTAPATTAEQVEAAAELDKQAEAGTISLLTVKWSDEDDDTLDLVVPKPRKINDIEAFYRLAKGNDGAIEATRMKCLFHARFWWSYEKSDCHIAGGIGLGEATSRVLREHDKTGLAAWWPNAVPIAAAVAFIVTLVVIHYRRRQRPPKV